MRVYFEIGYIGMVYPQRVDQVNLYPCSSFKRRVYPDVKRNVLIRAGTTSPWSRNCLDSSRGLCVFSTSPCHLYIHQLLFCQVVTTCKPTCPTPRTMTVEARSPQPQTAGSGVLRTRVARLGCGQPPRFATRSQA